MGQYYCSRKNVNEVGANVIGNIEGSSRGESLGTEYGTEEE